MNSREKGKRGERQWRDELRANGYHARRGQQFSGSPDSPDVVCEELDWLHFEVKAVERLNIEDAMEQARQDCGARNAECGVEDSTPHPGPLPVRGGEGRETRTRKVPVVAHRRSHRRWLVTMDAETFFRFLRGELPPTDGTKRTDDGAHGVTRPTKRISEVSGEAPDTAGGPVVAPLAAALPKNKTPEQT